jgi:hypothetical protein
MSELARYSRLQSSQVAAMNKQVENKLSRVQNIALRNEWMTAKISKTYQTEYDRIRNHLSDALIPHQTKDTIIKRKKVLEKLGAKSFDIT